MVVCKTQLFTAETRRKQILEEIQIDLGDRNKGIVA